MGKSKKLDRYTTEYHTIWHNNVAWHFIAAKFKTVKHVVAERTKARRRKEWGKMVTSILVVSQKAARTTIETGQSWDRGRRKT